MAPKIDLTDVICPNVKPLLLSFRPEVDFFEDENDFLFFILAVTVSIKDEAAFRALFSRALISNTMAGVFSTQQSSMKIGFRKTNVSSALLSML